MRLHFKALCFDILDSRLRGNDGNSGLDSGFHRMTEMVVWIPASVTLAKRESKACRVRGNDRLFAFILRTQVLPVGAGNGMARSPATRRRTGKNTNRKNRVAKLCRSD